jgi:hypothetical protein
MDYKWNHTQQKTTSAKDEYKLKSEIKGVRRGEWKNKEK